MNDYNNFLNILNEELIPAMGCTEPISVALCASKAKEVLKEEATKAILYVSPNIVKNVKSVVVPHTGGLVGLKAALIAGLVFGNASLDLDVLSKGSKEDEEIVKQMLETFPVQIKVIEDSKIFEIAIKLFSNEHNAYVKIADSHINISLIEYDRKIIYSNEIEIKEKTDRSFMSIKKIVEFAKNANIDDVKEIIERQIKYNLAICNEGLTNNYGANIGKVYLSCCNDDVYKKIKAYAAAGSDARMNGCELPVIINSGSGNQGITCSVPVYVYGKEMNIEYEKIIRALLISNLVTIHLKNGIGPLSAYCGVVSASAGAASGISYLNGKDYEQISNVIINSLAIDSGIICDGAKASCAAKIATSLETCFLGIKMEESNNNFSNGDGIVKQGVENTIKSVNRLASVGMLSTDKEIIKIMLEKK